MKDTSRTKKLDTGQKWASQCKECRSVEVTEPKKQPKYIPSIVNLPSLPAKLCYSCKLKNHEKAEL